MFSDKRYAPIAAELKGVAERLGMEVHEVEEFTARLKSGIILRI